MIFGGERGNWMKVGDDWINLSDPEAVSDYRKVVNGTMNLILILLGTVMTIGYFFFDGGIELCIIGPSLIVLGILCFISRIFHRIFWWAVFIAIVVGIFLFLNLVFEWF